MIKNFLKISIRNFIKNKSNTLINITGLSLGITCSLIIFLIITFETSFNNFNKNSKGIYRLVIESNEYGEDFKTAGLPYPAPAFFKTAFSSQIENISFVDANIFDQLVTIRHDSGRIDKYNESLRFAFVNPSYFKMFTYQWLRGDSRHALDRPHTAVISETLARKYFGSLDVIGKNIEINRTNNVEVTGVVKDPPLNSDLPFHLLIEIEGSGRIDDNMNHSSSNVQCFIQAKNKISQAGLDQFMDKFGNKDPQVKKRLYLQPLNEMHLNDKYELFTEAVVSKETLWALGCIGVFLILMACINYINLNTATAIKRAKEVGIRKVLGGRRIDVVINFLVETSLLAAISIIVSMALTELSLGALEKVLGYKLSLAMFNGITLWGSLTAVFVIIVLSAGLYPAVYLSGFKSMEAVRTRTSTSDNNSVLRKTLVITQFAIAHIIIIGTIIVINQLDYFKSKDLGFNKEAILEINLPENKKEELNLFSNRLSEIPEVKSFSFSNTGAASPALWTSNFKYTSAKNVTEDRTQVKMADVNYFKTYGISVIAGRGLFESDTVAEYVVNQAFVRAMGLGNNYVDAVGKIIHLYGEDAPIVGVVKDFNSQTLHEKVSPMAISSQTDYYMQAGIKINMRNYKSAEEKIKKAWLTAYPDYVFEAVYLDETIKKFYEREERTSVILNSFSFIAILIGCLGLFGLAAYSINAKTKEIGIRKVLGASLTNILTLITKDFFKLIIAGFAIAVPAAYYLMNTWLEDFAYKITIGPGVFIIAVAATSIVALATVGYMSLKAATANPVKSLKYE